MDTTAVEAQQVEQPAEPRQEEEQHEPKQEQQDAPEPKQEPQQEPAVAVTDEELKTRLAVLLGKSDLATTTEKMLRKSLEKELGVKLDDRKALIRQQVEAYLASVQPAEDEGSNGGDDGDDAGSDDDDDGSDGGRPASKRRRGNGSAGDAMGSLLSPALAEFLGVERMARPTVVKKLWEYIKAHNLQEPSNKRNIIVDAKLATLFTPPINMFSMNKQLSKHVFTKKDVVDGDGDSDGGGDDDDAPRAKRAARPRAPPAKKGGGGGGFTKPMRLSDELAAATGQSHMSRGGVTKWFWAYISEHDLKDPSDKRFVLSDDTLKRLTGQDRFQAFGYAKLISQHFLKD